LEPLVRNNVFSVWEILLQLTCHLNTVWKAATGELLAKMPEASEDIRRRRTSSTRCASAKETRRMTSWHVIVKASMDYIKSKPEQLELF